MDAQLGVAFSAALGDIEAVPILVPPGEASKSWAGLQTVVDALLAQGVERSDHIVAFGGGVVGDLAGFAAAIVNRGCGFVQMPTSLLAQVDSSVGGKTAINVAAGKNLVGAFHQPSLVLIDPSLLDTLDPRQVRAGYAEIVKYALIGDCGAVRLARGQWREGPRRRSRRAHAGDRRRRRGKGAHRRRGRARDQRPAGFAQSRPHVRPRARSRDGIFRPPAARRGGRAWAACSPSISPPSAGFAAARTRSASERISIASACRPHSRSSGCRGRASGLPPTCSTTRSAPAGGPLSFSLRGIGEAFVDNVGRTRRRRRVPRPRRLMIFAEVIGDPIAQSKSPLIHKYWLDRLGIDGDYVRTRVPADRARELSRSPPLRSGLARLQRHHPAQAEPSSPCSTGSIRGPKRSARSIASCRRTALLIGYNTDVDGSRGGAGFHGDSRAQGGAHRRGRSGARRRRLSGEPRRWPDCPRRA